VFTTENMVVFAPIPSASVSTATAANPRLPRRPRKATMRSEAMAGVQRPESGWTRNIDWRRVSLRLPAFNGKREKEGRAYAGL
jgi:hypothetical protein